MEHLNAKILNYKLTRYIGEGGMASVYEGTHEKLGTKVAVKILNPILTANKEIRQRFENEAKFMAMLDHPNIVKVLDFDEQPLILAIIMELLHGMDLVTYIKLNGALTPEEAIPVFEQILDAFEYAHLQGVVHRDIKPANIFIEKNNKIKILDFGIAKIFGATEEFTHTGTQMGTPVYMSPEQVKADKSIDHRSDIYSLGVSLFYALEGKPPYDVSTLSNYDIYTKIVIEPIPDLTNYPEINQVIQKAVAKDRDYRFQKASEFKYALLETIKGKSGGTIVKDTDNNVINNDKPFVYISDLNKTIVHKKETPKAVENFTKEPEKPHLSNPINRNRMYYTIGGIGIVSFIVLLFFLLKSDSSYTDSRDGKKYKTVKIGKQVWMAENLDFKTSTGSWCYENSIDNCAKYGRLYNWETAMQVCPNGWHLPGNSEWAELINYLDRECGKLKATEGWNSPNTGAKNSSGFTAIPGGGCNSNGTLFSGIGESGRWWSSSEDNPTDGCFGTLCYNLENIDTGHVNKGQGCSVRCIKD